jgi:hypothetical protein
MRRHEKGGVVRAALLTGLSAVALAAPAFGISSVNLDFNGSGNTLAATGFGGVYTIDPSGFNVGGGKLTINTLPGDTFGNYENDPDSARNMFYTVIEPLAQTTVEARVNVSGLNVNFHGGGIWMGTDQDHYIRLGIINNTFEGGISAEGLRENQDRWGGATPPGPGDDIVNRQFPNVGTSPQVGSLDVILRLVRTGNTSQAFFSTNNGATFNQVGGPGFTYTGLALPGDPQGAGSNTIEPPGDFKVGVYAFGGPDGSTPAVFAFDSFSAVSVPEPATAMLCGALGMLALARDRRRC